MARKVFVSYKHSDAVASRDRIINALNGNGNYYKGEKGYKALKYADSTMKNYLGTKIFDSTVTVVIISPNVKQSNWVEWEIKYSMERHSRGNRKSSRNGVLCIIQSCDDYSSPKPGWSGYNKNSNWAYNKHSGGKDLKKSALPQIIWKNMKDSFSDENAYWGYLKDDESNYDRKDYCVIVAESTFLKNPNKYIDEAFLRASNNDLVTVTRY